MIRNKAVLLAAVAALSLSLFSAGCRKLEARDNLNKGVQAFKGAKYAEAVEFFKTAIELDPEYPTARLYLATAYMSQYIPGAESPENLAYAKSAMENFELVLETDPTNATAVESIASLFFLRQQGAAKLEDKIALLGDAEKWYKRLTEVEPTRKEAWYSLGVIAWAKWYPAWMEARNKAGMKPEAPGPLKDKKLREELSEKYLEMVNTGIKNLEKALEIDAEYDDAMAYMNLLLRERADLAEQPAAYDADIEAADNWMQKALETRKIKAERQPAATGIAME
ncbi:MAG: tetratricopeptide repeat protein [Bryobacteraceae bacterium]|nr:tetratricopeptide repeat protein [Solibacteraceae bacterium]MCL4843397.1 tetratricopeptide repeat protein [Bryobacteraceae bacterium]MCO5352530.1 tetratricopeptide repeat protein [Bryobacteraceae bacterium]HRJ20212.1 tetratricopeptide repeat protein [Bryobacteraceae bacterium]